MVPPWVPDAAPTPNPSPEPQPQPEANPAQEQQQTPAAGQVPISPAGRFTGARRSLGGFARSGDGNSLRRGIGNYVRTGYQGASGATRRFGGTAQTANALFGALGGG